MFEGLRDPGIHLPPPDVPHPQREGNIFEDVQMRPNGERLEDHPQPPVLRLHVEIALLRGHRLVADPDLSVAEILEPRDHPERGRLSTSRRPQQGEALALFDRQIEVVDRGHLSQSPRGEFLRDVLQDNLAHETLLLSLVTNRSARLPSMMISMAIPDSAADWVMFPSALMA